MKHNIGHSCTVEKQTSGSFLPPLPKEANCFQRCIRAYKKFIQVSIKDPLTQEYFRSTTGFLNERKRHAQSKYSYIIHPFSDFARYVASIEFLLDVLTAFSFCTVHRMVNLQKHYYLALFRLLKIFKLFSFLKYWTLVAQRWNFSAVATELVKYFAMTMILIHWTTCLFYYVTISYILIGEEIEEEDYDTHFVLEGNITALYFACLYETMGILYCARSSWSENSSLPVIAMITSSFVLGRVYMLVVKVSTLNQVFNQWSLETKYLGITDQLKEFMRYKKLPLNLRQRMQHYFEYKFQYRYFRENLITSILSDKLKREINIQVCKRLVQQAAFLADLPTKVLGDVLTHLKSEVFLPNDVIIRAGAPGDCMYFLSSGTVLVTTPSGKEVCHLQDGAYFGEIALLSKETKRTANVIALEICETYRLDKKVFKMSIKKYPDCVKVIQALAEIRHQETNALEEMHKEELFHKTYIGENETLEGSLKIPRRYRSESS
ncbi:potassium/sodium hyperpolarization-activated cyclic nucleotide-gated channel 2-like isoform X2 [Coccinella septempunctata]|uniref:potassium/sodium hyperpolarization-activated cyclic nucleotide-gated channel 2-like isoform X2 n=1 Tax=Coccinella septempunctata TaxID=41139 RepID=UPI001D0806D3|nr:potassium/sodium hyperpolarization-activated cyclic nucleotide-gated channel 2-like isoform X2 [Coccinella septempunctata]